MIKFSNSGDYYNSNHSYPLDSNKLGVHALKSKLYGLLINLITNLCFDEVEIDEDEIMKLLLSNEFTLDEFFELFLNDVESQTYLQFKELNAFFGFEVKILSRNKYKELSSILADGNGTASLIYQAIIEFILVSELPDGCSPEAIFLNSYSEVLKTALNCSLNAIVSITNFIASPDYNSKVFIADFFSFKANYKGETFVSIDLEGLLSYLNPPVSGSEVLGCPAARISKCVRSNLYNAGFDMHARTYIELQMIAVAKWLPTLQLAYEEGRLKL
jgi:hypothetical protein